MSIAFALLRSLSLVRISPELGLGTKIFDVGGGWAAMLGLVFYLAIGGVVGLTIGWILAALRITHGIIGGVIFGFSLWFGWSMMVGTFPMLDFLVPAGTPILGPMGVYGGSVTFYSLLALHGAFGGWVGYWLSRRSA